jgi:hypothetical protein
LPEAYSCGEEAMSVSVSIAAGAAAQSAAANAAASHARKVACMKFVQGYQNDTATTAEMREYAECVGRLYPNPMSSNETLALKASIVIVLLAMVAGLIFGHQDRYGPHWAERYLLFPFFFGIGAVAVLMVLAAIVWSIRFLVS